MCTTRDPLQVQLPASLSSGRAARALVLKHWCTVHDSASIEVARLLVTELVVNAVEHGGPPVWVSLECLGPEAVMLRVSDGGRDLPRHNVAAPGDEGGRGVHLVELFSSQWGIEEHSPARAGATSNGPSGSRWGPVGSEPGAPAHDEVVKTIWCRLVR